MFRLLHEKLRAGWKENLKYLSKHALLLGTSEYDENYHSMKAYTPRDHYRQKLDFLLSDQTLL